MPPVDIFPVFCHPQQAVAVSPLVFCSHIALLRAFPPSVLSTRLPFCLRFRGVNLPSLVYWLPFYLVSLQCLLDVCIRPCHLVLPVMVTAATRLAPPRRQPAPPPHTRRLSRR